MPDYGQFEGRDIAGIKMKVTKAGDGLSKALATMGEREPHRSGEEVSIVLRGKIGPVQFTPNKDDDSQTFRLEELVTETITIVDPGLVDDIIDDQKKRNEEHAEQLRLAKTGQPRIPGADSVTTSDDTLDSELEGSE